MAKKRTLRRVPALNPNELAQAALVINSLHISKGGKETLKQIVQAAANPNAERVDVVIQSLPPTERSTVMQSAAAVQTVNAGVRGRARRALLDMPDDDWQKLLSEAERGE